MLFRLFFLSHPIWGSLTLIFPLVGFLMAVMAVLFGRLQRGDPMPVKKFVLLTIVSLASVFEAFFESAPQLVCFLNMALNFSNVQLSASKIWSTGSATDHHLAWRADR